MELASVAGALLAWRLARSQVSYYISYSVAGALLAWRLAPSQVSYYTLSGLMVKPGFW